MLVICAVVTVSSSLAKVSDERMYGKTHREVLRMGLVAWKQTYAKKATGMSEQFEASGFYTKATCQLNDAILKKMPKTKRKRWLELRQVLREFNGRMFEVVLIAVGGASSFGWGIDSLDTSIALEEYVYKSVTGKEYHEDPIKHSGGTDSYTDWAKLVSQMAKDSSEANAALAKSESTLKKALKLAGGIGAKQQKEVEVLVAKISGYWITKLK